MTQIEYKATFLSVLQFLYPMEVFEWSESGKLDSLMDEITTKFQVEIKQLLSKGLTKQEAKEIAWGNSILRLKGYQMVVEVDEGYHDIKTGLTSSVM